MPAEVCDLDRTWAHRVVWAAFEAHVLQVVEGMQQGQRMLIHAPDYRAENRVAQLIADFREEYLGPERDRRDTRRAANTMLGDEE